VNASGIQPDIIIARSSEPLDAKRREKLSFFCNVPEQQVISAPDVTSIYDIPTNFEKAKVPELIAGILGLRLSTSSTPRAIAWKKLVKNIASATEEVRIGIVGKYFETGDFVLSDAYLSVIEALKFSAFALGKKPVLEWVNAGSFEENPKSITMLKKYDGILVPGGFGNRGIEGKIAAIRYAREHGVPYFGLCYGMQLAVVEFARHKAGIAHATTREIHPQSDACVIDLMDTQKEKMKKEEFGGSMRLGSYEAVLKKGTVAQTLYGTMSVLERHRHRFEVNPLFIPAIEKAGLVFSATSPDGSLMEIAELPKSTHPFFVGTQFHPEFQAHPLAPHPLFTGFIKAAALYKKSK
jgi:CTP synthase